MVLFPAGQKKVGVTAEVAAEAEKEIDTETKIERRTGKDGIVLDHVQGLGHVPETVIVTETETAAKEETNLLVVLLALEKIKTETLTAGRTNMWIAPHLKSLL